MVLLWTELRKLEQHILEKFRPDLLVSAQMDSEAGKIQQLQGGLRGDSVSEIYPEYDENHLSGGSGKCSVGPHDRLCLWKVKMARTG